MSSKSRRKTTPPTKSREQEQAPEPEEHGLLDIPDELIHAPKETSKLRFVLMIALVVLLLLIFAIPGSIGNLAGRGGREEPVEFTWNRPGHEPDSVTYTRSREELRSLASALQLDPFVGFQIGITDRPTIEDGARIHVLDTLARDAGVHVTDDSLGKHIQQIIQFIYRNDLDTYERNLAQFGPDIERVHIRRCLRVKRFLELAGYAGAVAHPDDIEKLWRDEHTELALDWFTIASSEFEEAARADLPDDASLEAWLDEQPVWEQTGLRTPERRTAEVAVYRDADSTPATALLVAYPADADVDLEQQADDYYNIVFARRFAKPAEEPAEGEEQSAPPKPPGFFTFDEVREQCLAEAPVYYAMQSWLDDVRARTAAEGEAETEVDFAGEAAAMGLEVVTVTETSREGLIEHADLGDPSMVNSIFSTPLDAFSFLSITKGVIGFGHVSAIAEETLPPFPEIRDKVAELWIAPRSKELAEEHMQTLFEGFATFVPEEDPDALFPPLKDESIHRRADADAFAAAADGEVSHRDYLDAGGRREADPDHEDTAHTFLWSQNASLKRLVDGEVAAPLASPDGEMIYLVRLAGKRAVPVDKMSPGDFERLTERARSMAQSGLALQFDVEYLEKEYGLRFPNREAEETASNDDAPSSE